MRVINRRKQTGETVYIGRPSIFGNPFLLGKDGTREQVINKYTVWVAEQPDVLKAIVALPKDAVLGCYCKPRDCHGDVIMKIWKEMHR